LVLLFYLTYYSIANSNNLNVVLTFLVIAVLFNFR
jgi:hypothetical protein